MTKIYKVFCFVCITIASLLYGIAFSQNPPQRAELTLNDLGYFEVRGLQVLVFNNWYDGNFSDAKISGVELIHHGVRTATNGDVRLSPTPGQWDPIPQLVERKVVKNNRRIEVLLHYPAYNFFYTIQAEASDRGFLLSVILEKPLPKNLEGIAGLNFEFLPSAYFEKAYMMDGKSGIFPLYPSGPMEVTATGKVEPMPIASGNTLVLAPEDPARRVTVKNRDGFLSLYDGRNQAQNGWFVVRTLIPAGKSGKVIEWCVEAGTIPGWARPPVIAHSQVGYHPGQKKVAVMEFDRNDHPLASARLLRIRENGEFDEIYKTDLKHWGRYLRYEYWTFDFTSVQNDGLYIIEYDTLRTKPFRIAADVYEKAWQPTLDVFFPVQMDHMFVREAYRVWHGASHLDDARQAPVNLIHFDLYAQGPTTDTPYKPGEHIPGLNIGGWYDAGDHDIRTQTQYATVMNLARTWETFSEKRDETTVDQEKRYVEIHRPDGIPDLIQQIEHGTLALLAQHRAVGHAIPGIIVGDLRRYTHLGDAVTITDNIVGTDDDRWAFTSRSTALNFGSIAGLAAASRALKGYNDTLATECLATALKVWDEEQSHAPDTFRSGNTTGGVLEIEELQAAVELLLCTRDVKYAKKINILLPKLEDRFGFVAGMLVRALPLMDESYSKRIEILVKKYRNDLEPLYQQNPFGVPITTGGWAGSGAVIAFSITNYILHKAFPHIIDMDAVFNGLNYLYGCHPGSDISFVSGVGTHSKKIAYGYNRADFSFIAGGIVPGVLVLKPDFPENKEDWPFLWGENEYVVNMGSSYIYLVQAVNQLVREQDTVGGE